MTTNTIYPVHPTYMIASVATGPNLLVLRGIFPRDFTTISTRAIASTAPKIDPAEVYTALPTRFTSVEDWPDRSNLKCWHCDLLPRSYPRFLPLNLSRDSDGRDICDPHGNFCEWGCVVAYIEREFPPDQRGDHEEAVLRFECLFSHDRKKKIMPAPPRTRRKEYCGPTGVTPAQYRTLLENNVNNYGLTTYGITQLTPK